ncbi:FIG00732786: hypothetical protein [Klebsiella pneumoniae IS39]|nr:FIG00732786: hypothetical protein [Klebsiella pneumoniae IS39]
MDTLRWLNDDEFPFLTTPFHPPPGLRPTRWLCDLHCKNGRIASWSTEKKRPILSPPSRNHAPAAIPRGESQSLILPSPPP